MTPQDQRKVRPKRRLPKLPNLRRKRDQDENNTTSWRDDFRTEDSFVMRPVYAVILSITAIAFVATVMYPTGMPRFDKYIDRFGANVTTEGLGITFTLAVIDRFLEQQDRRRRLRGSIRALRRAALALERMTGAWAPLIAGTLDSEPTQPPQTMETLFAPHYTENLMALDFQRPRSRQDPEGATWMEWTLSELRSGLDVLSDVGLRYSIILDSSYIEAIDHLIDDNFVEFLQDLLDRPGTDMRSWRVALNTARGHREGHFNDLVRMLKVHNNLAREAGQVRTRSAGPTTGLLGVELAPDHDLRAPWRIERSAWRRLPAPSSLRMSLE